MQGLLHYSTSSKVSEFGTNGKLIFVFLSVINKLIPGSNFLPGIRHLHCFRDIPVAFDRSKIAIFGYPFCVLPHPPSRRRVFPRTISVKFYLDHSWMSMMAIGVE